MRKTLSDTQTLSKIACFVFTVFAALCPYVLAASAACCSVISAVT